MVSSHRASEDRAEAEFVAEVELNWELIRRLRRQAANRSKLAQSWEGDTTGIDQAEQWADGGVAKASELTLNIRVRGGGIHVQFVQMTVRGGA